MSKIKKVPTNGKQAYTLSIVLLFAFIFAANNSKLASNDTFWNLKMGEWMVQNKAIYTHEVFVSTVLEKPYIAYQWLSQVFFYLIADINGISLSVFKLLLILCGSFFIGRYYFNKYKEGSWTYPILMISSFFVAFRGELRSELFGTFFSAYLIYRIEKWRDLKSYKVLIPLIPAQIIWANTHGSFLLGPFLVFFYAGAILAGIWFSKLQRDKEEPELPKSALTLIGLAFSLLLASVINPFGPGLIQKSASMFFNNSYMREYIKEWWSILQFPLENWYALWILSILFGFYCLYKARNQLTLRDLLAFLLALYFPFSGVRYVTLSSLILMPILLKYSHIVWPKGFNPKLQIKIFLPITLFIAIVGYPENYHSARPPGIGHDFRVIPLEIHQHLKAHEYKGVIMNDYNDGSYFVYYNTPEVRPVIDSRTELYGEKLFLEHADAFTHYEFYQNFMTRHHADFAVTRSANGVLRNFLFRDPNWVLEKTGFSHDLFRRKGSNETNLQYAILDRGALTPKKRYCIFVRLLGRCYQTDECREECRYNDATIASLLKLSDSNCIKFTQICQQKVNACTNCRDYCMHYQAEVGKINSKFFGANYEEPIKCN